MGLVKTRRLAYPPLAGVRDPWGSEHAERSECRAMHPPSRCALRRTGKQQRAKVAMKPPMKGAFRSIPEKAGKGRARVK